MDHFYSNPLKIKIIEKSRTIHKIPFINLNEFCSLSNPVTIFFRNLHFTVLGSHPHLAPAWSGDKVSLEHLRAKGRKGVARKRNEWTVVLQILLQIIQPVSSIVGDPSNQFCLFSATRRDAGTFGNGWTLQVSSGSSRWAKDRSIV